MDVHLVDRVGAKVTFTTKTKHISHVENKKCNFQKRPQCPETVNLTRNVIYYKLP